jgi:hypothetical protein
MNQPRLTARHAEFFAPVDDRGKWHARWLVTGTAVCGTPVILDDAKRISVRGGMSWAQVHPIICRRCLRRATSTGYSAAGIDHG